MLNPSRNQENLKKALKQRGYELTFSAPILVGSLEGTLPPDREGYHIKEVGEEKLSDWIIPLKEAYKATKEDALRYQEAHARALRKKAKFHHFVAYAEEKPVASGTLSLSSDGARLDDLGVLPAYQGKGFGRAMALYRMNIAKALGYQWICLEGSDQGASLYKQMGFQELYPIKVYRKKRAL
jgi:GNAT superfamily N-acetyltransferase